MVTWSRTMLLVLPLLLLAPSNAAKGERNVQRFVKIDVSKINVKNATDTSNVTSATLTPETRTEGSTSLTTATTPTSTAASSSINSTVSTATTTTTTESTTPSTAPPVTSATIGSVDATSKPIDVDPQFPPLTEGRAAKLVPRGYFCQCDLKINTCDVNCCCDIDCNETILKAFDCDEEQLHRDEYHHDAGLQSCRVQGGLFCLVEPIHEEGDESYYDPKRLPDATRYRWKDVFSIDPTGSDDSRVDHYRVGDIVNFFNETSEAVQSFDIPYSLTDSACQIGQPVRFLRATSNLCRRTVEDLAAFNRAFMAHHRSVRFFRTPKRSTVMEHYCVEEQDCINVTLSVCQSIEGSSKVVAGWNCSQNFNTTSNATTDASVEFLEEDGGGTGTCDRLEINFYHNYTQLLAVRMQLFCRPDPPDTWDDTYAVWQRVVVNFPTVSGKRSNTSRTVSGNLGYLIGKPLIVSHLEVAPNGTLGNDGATSEIPAAQPMLAYFTNGTRLPDDSFRLRLPVSKANRCTLTGQLFQTINFGVNSWNRCNFVPMNMGNVSAEATSAQNYTQLCRDLQAGLYDHLLHGVRNSSEGYDSLNLYLSKYANPINRTADWIRMRAVNVIPDAQPGSDTPDSAALGAGGEQDYFTCNNMLINVDYRFYYARERVREVRHQAVLHAGEVVFGPRVNLRFRRDEEVRVPIFVQVQHFDLTSFSAGARCSPAVAILLTVLALLTIVYVCIFKH